MTQMNIKQYFIKKKIEIHQFVQSDLEKENIFYHDDLFEMNLYCMYYNHFDNLEYHFNCHNNKILIKFKNYVFL